MSRHAFDLTAPFAIAPSRIATPAAASAAEPGRWVLARNCSLAPRQLLVVYLSLCAVSLTLSAGFWWHGAPIVGAFAGVEMLCLGTALVVYARHAGDRDVVTLAGSRVLVQRQSGGRVEQHEFSADRLRVHAGALVELSGRGGAVRVGRYVPPQTRAAFARELRRALSGYELKQRR